MEQAAVCCKGHQGVSLLITRNSKPYQKGLVNWRLPKVVEKCIRLFWHRHWLVRFIFFFLQPGAEQALRRR